MKKQKIAYTLSPTGINLEVKHSANAWWMDRQKLHDLISVFSLGATIREARGYVGISEMQYKYFVREHPTFNEIRERLVLTPQINARITVVRALGTDPKMAWWWLKKKCPEEFGSPSQIRRGQIRRERKGRMEANIDNDLNTELSKEEKDALDVLRKARQKRITDRARQGIGY